jgi:hypothetical protein
MQLSKNVLTYVRNAIKAQGKTRLRMWAKSRVADRAVMVLFKKLTLAIRNR